MKGTVALKNLRLSGDEEYMLANLSETILPVKNEAPADAAHYFVLTMVDDCLINIDYDDNDEKMIKDFMEEMTEMYTRAGFTDLKTKDSKQAPGLDILEMGGVRMAV